MGIEEEEALKKYLVVIIPLVVLVLFGIWRGFTFFADATAEADIRDAESRLYNARIDYRLAQAHQHLNDLTDWAIKTASAYMREAEVRAVVEAVKNGADEHFTVDLLLRLIERESSFNPNAIGKIGEVGLLQVLPSSAGMTRAELLDPETNIRVGVLLLKRLRAKFGDVALALVAYGTGEYSPAVRGVKYVLKGE
jgi:soluble lytic murein transglycosylase-like protein